MYYIIWWWLSGTVKIFIHDSVLSPLRVDSNNFLRSLTISFTGYYVVGVWAQDADNFCAYTCVTLRWRLLIGKVTKHSIPVTTTHSYLTTYAKEWSLILVQLCTNSSMLFWIIPSGIFFLTFGLTISCAT